MPTDIEIAYAAGLFEGEGTTVVTRWYYPKGKTRQLRKTPQIKLRVGMTDLAPLHRLQLAFGGGIYGPYGHKKKRKDGGDLKIYWLWNLDSPPAVKAALTAMEPFLSPRRLEQVRVAYSI